MNLIFKKKNLNNVLNKSISDLENIFKNVNLTKYNIKFLQVFSFYF